MKREHVARAHEPIEMSLLRRDAHEQACSQIDHGVVTEHKDPASRRTHQSRGSADQGRLAGPIRAQQPNERSRRHAQAELIERLRPIGVDLRQTLHPQRAAGAVQLSRPIHLKSDESCDPRYGSHDS
jgi:hypothetical protein